MVINLERKEACSNAEHPKEDPNKITAAEEKKIYGDVTREVFSRDQR